MPFRADRRRQPTLRLLKKLRRVFFRVSLYCGRGYGGVRGSVFRETMKQLESLWRRQVRSAYTAELQQRTELENMLRAAVEEVRQKVG